MQMLGKIAGWLIAPPRNTYPYGVDLDTDLPEEVQREVVSAVLGTANKFAGTTEDMINRKMCSRPRMALQTMIISLYKWEDQIPCAINGSTCLGFTTGSRHICLYKYYYTGAGTVGLSPISVNLILHEMGHAFNQRLRGLPVSGFPAVLLTRDNPDGFFAEPYIGQFSTRIAPSEILPISFWAGY